MPKVVRRLALSIIFMSAVAAPLGYFKVFPFNQGVKWPKDYLLIVAGAAAWQVLDWLINRCRNRS